ncbi:MAG: hypothetical protein FD180_1203 [Planctomycetota bacterium]|nr:MAG: hypothetical protein FD180_1203 [Planctomycetota bacterium]
MNRVLALFLLLAGSAFADHETAVRLVKESLEASKQNDMYRAEELATQAIAADPGWAEGWMMRAYVKMAPVKRLSALIDINTAIDIEKNGTPRNEPLEHQCLNIRGQALRYLDRFPEALEQAEAVLARWPGDTWATGTRSGSLVGLGAVDEGIAGFEKLMTAQPREASALPEARNLTGDWARSISDADAIIAAYKNAFSARRGKAQALIELGKYDEARQIGDEVAKNFPSHWIVTAVSALLAGTPEYKAGFDPDKSVGLLESLIRDQSGATAPEILDVLARTLVLAERYSDAVALFTTRFPARGFWHQWWLGVSLWKLERFSDARIAFTQARRLNPYMTVHAKRFPGLDQFLAPTERDIAAERKAGSSESKLGFELATHLFTVAEIETLVRRFQFARAAAEYEKLQPTLLSPVRKAEVTARLEEVRGMAGALDKLVAAVNAKSGAIRIKAGKSDLTLTRADDRAFDFTITGGSGKFPWAYVAPLDFFKLANAQSLAPKERFALGVLLWDIGEDAEAQKTLGDPSAKDLKERVDAVVARKRGIEAPKGGFVLHKGRFVTPEEKTNLEKGLVRFQGQWVTTGDREKLAKGLIQVSGKWVSGEEKKLLAMGFRKFKDQWMSAEDYSALRGKWDNAFEEDTAHYRIRSNESEEFTKQLAKLVEVAYGEYRTFYGGREPKIAAKEKMTLYAFRTYEDYRRYCTDKKADAQLNAAGFASSDSNVVVGWNKTGNVQLFYQTMVHEAAHLYYYRICTPSGCPSWHAEAMATYFEGFEPAGDSWRFTFVSDSRLPYVRDAMKAGTHIPLKDLLAGDAGALINSDASKAILFYAECWSLNYYLTQTSDAPSKAAYAEYRKSAESGKSDPMSKFFTDMDKLEKDWLAFVKGL